ncbi:DNA starvation/stationary phase protection protein Dps [Nocardioides sp. zg-ZUI104]|uniref:DNA starvation/stationary phase protection protein Dps n=1 Tax=Nocardioides faecalis TaxID=2803858 RepID=UPI001BD17923|nr:DNA starvation/stationary phase protection protein Dps [Nocardioides faecalis]MBS4754125.1 DNA starvation/stationary phase protection protein Dps [Nocardioides faecalis]
MTSTPKKSKKASSSKSGKNAKSAKKTTLHYTTPGLDTKTAERVVALLQDRLHACNDLHLTLKHVHWNVVGPQFIAVHEMIDPQVEAVRGFADDLAERIATMGGSPKGTPGAIVAERTWDDYEIGRAGTQQHLGALDVVYRGVITSYREGIEELGDLDPITEDMFIAQTEQLELFHWFVRAHLEDTGGRLSTEGADSEVAAARAAG